MGRIRFILQRAQSRWQILLTLAFGAILAVALLATSPILVNTVIEFGLRRALLSADPLAGNLRLRATSRLDEASYQPVTAVVQQTLAAQFGPRLLQIIPSATSRALLPWVQGQLLAEKRVSLRFYGSGDSDIRQQSELIAGAWPTVAPIANQTAPVVISQEFAAAYGLQVGDRLPVSLSRSETEPTLWLEISGIIRPLLPSDGYWFGTLSPLRAQANETTTAEYTALVSQSDFFALTQALLPDSTSELSWWVRLDAAQISMADIPALQAIWPGLRQQLGALTPPVTIESTLPDQLAAFASQAQAVKAPLYFLTAEVVLLALYYVIMVAALSVQQVEREFAVLQSRGAAPAQILGLQAGEGVLLVGLAWLVGPFLGLGLVRWLTLAGPLADVAERGWVVALPAVTFGLTAVGALVCLVALLLPVQGGIRRSIVHYQQEAIRTGPPPLWQRYYLDVFALIVGLVLLARLQGNGSLSGGNGGVDWLLLLAPVALLVGAGTIVLRLFPLVLHGLAALASRGRGLPPALALWQAERNPSHGTRLVLLLTLAMALGVLATGLGKTLDVSEGERARYATGGAARLVAGRALPLYALANNTPPGPLAQVWRGPGSVTIGRDYVRFEVLAGSTNWSEIAHFRPDFAAAPLPDLLATLPLTTTQRPSLPLPGQPSQLGLWVWAAADPLDENERQRSILGDSALDRFQLIAKLRTAQGDWLAVELTSPESTYPADGWRFLAGDVPPLPATAYPLGLDAFWLRNQARRGGEFGGTVDYDFRVAFDDISVDGTAVYGWEDGAVWPSGSVTPTLTTTVRHSGDQSLHVFIPLEGAAEARIGLSNQIATSYPVLISEGFAGKTGATPGQTLNLNLNSRPMQVTVSGVVRYFPTLYETENSGFVLLDFNALIGDLNALGSGAVNGNEVWLGQTPEAATLDGITGVRLVEEAEAIRKAIKADPMALGLRSVTYFGYGLTAVLTLVGFATTFYWSARQKAAIYAVLRSLGMSPGQLYGTLILEQMVLIAAGLALGTLLGIALNAVTLPGLPVTFGQRPSIPPFVALNDGGAILRIVLSLAGAFALSLGGVGWLLWRNNLQRMMRIE